MLTYGDGVCDVDLNRVLDFHKEHGKAVTMTTAQPPGRFGSVTLESDSSVAGFLEKPKGDGGWVNAGFFIMEPGIFDYD